MAQLPLCLPHYRTRHGGPRPTMQAGDRQGKTAQDAHPPASCNDHHHQAATNSYRIDAAETGIRTSNDPRAYCDPSGSRRTTVTPDSTRAISPSSHRHHVATTTRTRYADRVPGEGTHSLSPAPGHSHRPRLEEATVLIRHRSAVQRQTSPPRSRQGTKSRQRPPEADPDGQ